MELFGPIDSAFTHANSGITLAIDRYCRPSPRRSHCCRISDCSWRPWTDGQLRKVWYLLGTLWKHGGSIDGLLPAHVLNVRSLAWRCQPRQSSCCWNLDPVSLEKLCPSAGAFYHHSIESQHCSPTCGKTYPVYLSKPLSGTLSAKSATTSDCPLLFVYAIIWYRHCGLYADNTSDSYTVWRGGRFESVQQLHRGYCWSNAFVNRLWSRNLSKW